MLLCYIGGVDELERLLAYPLVSIADLIFWVLSLLLKCRLSCPLVLGRGWDVDGGWNSSCWLLPCVVRALWRVVCYLRRVLMVSYFQLVETVFQGLHLYLYCCGVFCIVHN